MPSSVDTPATDALLRLRGVPLQTSQDVADYFGVAHSNLIWTLYRAPDEARYRHFEIPKRSGGMRPIHAPIGVLRELQDKLHLDLKALYRAHPHAHGFIDGRSVATNAADHTGKRWVLNIDLEDFFPTINFGRIRGLFLKPPFEMGAAAAAVCAQIATYRNGLPQGAPTSPVLSNFIAATLDRRLLRLARSNKLVYSRYADDITLSTSLAQFPPAIAIREQIAGGAYKIEAGDALEQAIAASGFKINAKKVRIQGHGVHQSVTGLCVNRRVNVERERVRKIRAMLHAWKKFGLEAAGAEHFDKHRGAVKRGRPGNVASAFRNIVYGHLSFVKMVRGPEDPVFLNLCAKVLELDPNPSKFIRQMVFGADDYEIFISHASEDKADIARPIFEACQRAALKAFLDEKHIGWGDTFTNKINTALGASRTVLAVVTSNSVTKEWPLLEINTALALEATGNKRVIPLVVGAPDLSKLPLIRSKKWLTWDGNPEKVAAELKRLIKGADTPAPAPAQPSVPIVARTESPQQPAAPPAPAEPQKAGWMSRLWSRNWSR